MNTEDADRHLEVQDKQAREATEYELIKETEHLLHKAVRNLQKLGKSEYAKSLLKSIPKGLYGNQEAL